MQLDRVLVQTAIGLCLPQVTILDLCIRLVIYLCAPYFFIFDSIITKCVQHERPVMEAVKTSGAVTKRSHSTRILNPGSQFAAVSKLPYLLVRRMRFYTVNIYYHALILYLINHRTRLKACTFLW